MSNLDKSDGSLDDDLPTQLPPLTVRPKTLLHSTRKGQSPSNLYVRQDSGFADDAEGSKLSSDSTIHHEESEIGEMSTLCNSDSQGCVGDGYPHKDPDDLEESHRMTTSNGGQSNDDVETYSKQYQFVQETRETSMDSESTTTYLEELKSSIEEPDLYFDFGPFLMAYQSVHSLMPANVEQPYYHMTVSLTETVHVRSVARNISGAHRQHLEQRKRARNARDEANNFLCTSERLRRERMNRLNARLKQHPSFRRMNLQINQAYAQRQRELQRYAAHSSNRFSRLTTSTPSVPVSTHPNQHEQTQVFGSIFPTLTLAPQHSLSPPQNRNHPFTTLSRTTAAVHDTNLIENLRERIGLPRAIPAIPGVTVPIPTTSAATHVPNAPTRSPPVPNAAPTAVEVAALQLPTRPASAQMEPVMYLLPPSVVRQFNLLPAGSNPTARVGVRVPFSVVRRFLPAGFDDMIPEDRQRVLPQLLRQVAPAVLALWLRSQQLNLTANKDSNLQYF